MRDDIQKILEISVNAPSGSNSQPWKFFIKDNQIDILALPEKDHPILNYRNRGTWVAHGALIENILISASNFGYKTNLQIFPDKSKPNLTAKIFLENSEPKNEPLFLAIPLRATNRKAYKKIPLTAEQKAELLNSTKEISSGLELLLTDNKEDMRVLGEAGSVNEIIMLENQELHKLFFDEIVWTKEEEAIKKSGLLLKTMELKPPQQLALKLFKKWKVMNFLNKFKIARGIAKGNAKIYSTGSAMGAIVCSDQDEEFIKAGRLLERIWLKAISMGLSLQLITGVLFFWQNIRVGKKDVFSEEQIKLIEDAYKKTASVFKVDQGLIALVFRIGYSSEPSALSIKKPPEISLEN